MKELESCVYAWNDTETKTVFVDLDKAFDAINA